jgi:hypothetical protein
VSADSTTFLAAAGGLLIVIAIAWRLASAWRARRSLKRFLASPDPEVRRAALAVATTQGLRRNARLLLGRAKVEEDAAVRMALAAAVRRHRWEPADTRQIVELRLWANRQPRSQGELEASAPRRLEP